MRASELKPGQFFEFIDLRERYKAVDGKHCFNSESRFYFINRHDVVSWCANDLSVKRLAVTDWDDAPPVAKPEPEQFAVGDWVVCVDAKDSLRRLELGKVYEVVSVDECGDVAVHRGLYFWASRFRRATPAEIAKATEPKPTEQFHVGDWLYCIEAHAPLVAGNVYKVLAVKRDGWPEVEEGQGYWNPKYFRRATADEIAANKPKSPLACESMDPCDCMIRQWVGKCPHVKIDYSQVASDLSEKMNEFIAEHKQELLEAITKPKPDADGWTKNGNYWTYDAEKFLSKVVNPPTPELTWTVTT